MEIALIGNPNVGKSTVFNGLTGMHQHTGNWPGKTVGSAMGIFYHKGTKCTLVDLPGTYSLAPSSAEEEVTRDYLASKKADSVIVVCDASCLERNLILALQVISLFPNTVVCINLMDEAMRRGIHIDFQKLRTELGVPVIGITARKKHDLAKLSALVCETKNEERSRFSAFSLSDIKLFIAAGGRIAEKVVTHSGSSDSRDRKLDRIFTSRLTGFPVMLLLLALVFWLTIKGANYPSAFLSNIFFSLQDKLSALLMSIGAPAWVNGVLIEGAYRTLAWVIAVMAPPMMIFFPLFTFLEDLGYLPRMAFNLDKFFKNANACGKQALTM